jgi:hypothetical protein
MPQPKRAIPIETIEPASEPVLPELPTPYVPALPAVRPDEDGYYHDANWVVLECDWPGLKPREGFKPLWAEFDTSLTFAEAMAIPDPFNTPFGELYPHIVPRIRAWNCIRRNAETGETEPVPPPSEIGIEAFQFVRPMMMAWLGFTLKTLHLGGGPNRGKETPPSSVGSDGVNADD